MTLLQLGDPFINDVAAYPEAVSDLLRGLAFVEPQQRLDTSELLRITGGYDEACHGDTLFRPQRSERHRLTPWLWEEYNASYLYVSTDFWEPT